MKTKSLPVLAAVLAILFLPQVRAQETRREEQQRAALEKVLAVRIRAFELESGTFEEAIEYLAAAYDLPVVIDAKAFERVGIKDVRTQKVWHKKVVRVPLRTVLTDLLALVDGTYRIQKGKLVIGPKDR